jgi:hypothetical protein
LIYSFSLSDGASTVSQNPFLGRGIIGRSIGRGLIDLLPSFKQKSPDSEPIKEYAKGQFEDGSPKKPGGSSGRGRGSSGFSSGKKIESILQQKDPVAASSSHALMEEEGQEKLPRPEKIQSTVSASAAREKEKVPEAKVDENEVPTVLKHGKSGEKYSSLTNCIMVRCDKNFGVFEYEVRFHPEVDNIRLRSKYLKQLKEVLGNAQTFDGVTLYLAVKLNEDITELKTVAVDNGGEINVKIIFRRRARLGECVHLYNVLFERIMGILNYQRVGRKSFDPTSPKIIPQHKLEGN